MIDVDAVISRIHKLSPDASEHEHRDAAIRLIVAYDGHEEAISRVLSFVDGVSTIGAIKGGAPDA